MELYFGNHNYYLGECKSVGELYDNGMVKSTIDELQSYGFKYNYVSPVPVYDMAKKITKDILKDKTINEVYYDACFSENLNIVHHEKIDKDKRSEMENFMNYPAIHLCNYLNLKNIKYHGLSQLGCSGIFGCIETACNSLRCSESNKYCLCITSEKIPVNCYFDRPQQKILHSEAASGCLVSNEKLEYQIIGYSSISNTNLNANMLELLLNFVSLTKMLLDKHSVNIADVENFLTPNFWPDFWERLVLFLKSSKETLNFDNIMKVAHAFSSDFIINLIKIENEGLIHADKIQIAYGYGYGSHIYCLIFKKV